MGFKNFYEKEKLIEESFSLLTEDEIDDILRFIDVERDSRSKNIKKTKPVKQGKNLGLNVIKFFVKDPKGSGDEQIGFVVHKNKEVKKMFCTCEDFYYRAYKNLLQDKMSYFKLLTKPYKNILNKKYRGQAPKEGMEGVRMCKHLIAVARKYVK